MAELTRIVVVSSVENTTINTGAGGSGGTSSTGTTGSTGVTSAAGNALSSAPSLSLSGEPRFPPAIAVQRLAPQVQRQLRETQELIKDSCAQLYGSAYGSPGPPVALPTVTGAGTAGPPAGPLRAGPGPVLARSTVRRPTLETQYSQELS
uniref:Uncharacterized protein n=1 Tax=Anopheles albimanus TaxID=7167 RepID=A0A182FG35_ANOAL